MSELIFNLTSYALLQVTRRQKESIRLLLHAFHSAAGTTTYYNYEQFSSIVLRGVFDANYKCIFVVVEE